ncbi:MAG: hypothetical protein QJR08_05535 [Bacillota bacterium]|nr:hypothetical protein [Bacillota bacterium]
MAEAKAGRNPRDEARRRAENRKAGAPEGAAGASGAEALDDADLRSEGYGARGAADDKAQAGWYATAATDAATGAIRPGAPGTSRQASPRYGNSPYDRAGKAGRGAASERAGGALTESDDRDEEAEDETT